MSEQLKYGGYQPTPNNGRGEPPKQYTQLFSFFFFFFYESKRIVFNDSGQQMTVNMAGEVIVLRAIAGEHFHKVDFEKGGVVASLYNGSKHLYAKEVGSIARMRPIDEDKAREILKNPDMAIGSITDWLKASDGEFR